MRSRFSKCDDWSDCLPFFVIMVSIGWRWLFYIFLIGPGATARSTKRALATISEFFCLFVEFSRCPGIVQTFGRAHAFLDAPVSRQSSLLILCVDHLHINFSWILPIIIASITSAVCKIELGVTAWADIMNNFICKIHFGFYVWFKVLFLIFWVNLLITKLCRFVDAANVMFWKCCSDKVNPSNGRFPLNLWCSKSR